MPNPNGINACLLVWTNILSADEDEFNEWYSRDHLRSRVIGVPGFESGRRFIAEVGEPKYLAYYEASDPTAFSSKPFLELVARPDPISQRFIPRFRDVIRLVGRKLGGVGRDFGGSVGVLAFDAAQGAKEKLRLWLGHQLPGQLVSLPGIMRAQTFETDTNLLSASVRVHTRAADRAPDFVVLMEGTLPENVDAARRVILSDHDVGEQGGSGIAYARARLMLDVRPE